MQATHHRATLISSKQQEPRWRQRGILLISCIFRPFFELTALVRFENHARQLLRGVLQCPTWKELCGNGQIMLAVSIILYKSKSLHVERCFKFSLQTVIAIFFS